MKRKLLTVVLVIFLLANVCFMLMSCKSALKMEYESDEKPTTVINPLNVTLPEEGDPQYQSKMIEQAYNIYVVANANYKALDKCAIWVTMNTSMGSLMTVPGFRYFVKDGEKYFYAEYSDGSDSGIAGLFSRSSTYYATVGYTDMGLDYLYVKKVVAPKIYEENGMVVTDADFSSVPFEEKTKPIYCKAQSQDYEQTEQKISIETIKEASITYNAEKGFYSLTIVLDLDNPLTTAITVKNIEASGVKDAAYTRIEEQIEVWDTGYFKYFRSLDDWKGKKGIDISSTIDYISYFYYQEEYCTFTRYQSAEWIAQQCEQFKSAA